MRRKLSDLVTEKAVIGLALAAAAGNGDGAALADLRTGHFADQKMAEVYRALRQMGNDGASVSALTVASVAGVDYQLLADCERLWGDNPMEGTVLLRQLENLRARRAIIKLADTMKKEALTYEGHGSDLLVRLERAVEDAAGRAPGGLPAIGEALDEAFDALEAPDERQWGNRVITGVRGLDDHLHNIPDGKLVILSGRPGMGKTSLARQIAVHNALAGRAAVYISLEQPKKDLLHFMLASEAKVSYSALHKQAAGLACLKREQMEALTQARQRLAGAPLWVLDQRDVPEANIDAALAAVRRVLLRHQVRVAVIDQANSLEAPEGLFGGDNQKKVVDHALKRLVSFAQRTGVVVILPAQIRRPDSGWRKTKEGIPLPPELDDLKDTGNLEQAADLVVLLHRPSYYQSRTVTEEGEVLEDDPSTQMAIAKCRFVKHGVIAEASWDGPTLRFY